MQQNIKCQQQIRNNEIIQQPRKKKNLMTTERETEERTQWSASQGWERASSDCFKAQTKTTPHQRPICKWPYQKSHTQTIHPIPSTIIADKSSNSILIFTKTLEKRAWKGRSLPDSRTGVGDSTARVRIGAVGRRRRRGMDWSDHLYASKRTKPDSKWTGRYWTHPWIGQISLPLISRKEICTKFTY